jgi:hypothetical protein
MRITIEDIPNPPFLMRGGISETSKFVVIDDGNQFPIKILVGVSYQTFHNADQQTEGIRTPNMALHRAHLVITTNITVTKFSVPKNRYGSNSDFDVEPLVFLNRTLDELIRPYLQNPTIYDIVAVKAEIIRVLAMITGENFHYVNHKWLTEREMYIHNNLIRYKSLKHKFVNA